MLSCRLVPLESLDEMELWRLPGWLLWYVAAAAAAAVSQPAALLASHTRDSEVQLTVASICTHQAAARWLFLTLLQGA